MGAFNFLQQPQRRANLTTALDADPAVHVYRFRQPSFGQLAPNCAGEISTSA
jgi:hypothetical protein